MRLLFHLCLVGCRPNMMNVMKELKTVEWYRGKLFLRLCRKLGIEVTAFVVSNGRSFTGGAEGLPVYEYSYIPFEKDRILIVQTVVSDKIVH